MSTLQRILATELTPKANPKVGDVWETRMDNALSPIIKSGSSRPDPNYTLPAGITVRILHHDNRNEVRFRSPGGASVLSISDFSRNYKFKEKSPYISGVVFIPRNGRRRYVYHGGAEQLFALSGSLRGSNGTFLDDSYKVANDQTLIFSGATANKLKLSATARLWDGIDPYYDNVVKKAPIQRK